MSAKLLKKISAIIKKESSGLQKEIEKNNKLLKALSDLESADNLTFRIAVNIKCFMGDDDYYQYEGTGPIKDMLSEAVSYFQKKSGLSPESYSAYAYGYDVWIIIPERGAYPLSKKIYIDYNQDIRKAKTTRFKL